MGEASCQGAGEVPRGGGAMGNRRHGGTPFPPHPRPGKAGPAPACSDPPAAGPAGRREPPAAPPPAHPPGARPGRPPPARPDARAYKGLFLLPPGGVRRASGSKGGPPFSRTPRLWNSADARAWSDTLAAEPASRQYHSAAVLLPDARVLCSSGPPSETQGTIFWPPYLFNRDGTRATRPVITSLSSDSVPYGGTITVRCDTASKIGVVGLI